MSGADTDPESRLARLCSRDGDPPPTMLVLAHPDDETVGAATLLPRLGLGTFVYVTDGAPRDLGDARAAGCPTRKEYANVRRGETLSALESIGVAAARVEFIDYVDQEASFHLAGLARWLEVVFREHAPAIVLTHPYEGGHPDHDATAFAVRAAVRRIERAGEIAPTIAEFTSYHAAGSRWEFGRFLPHAGAGRTITRTLTTGERMLKQRLISCYPTQRGVLQTVRMDAESFRLAPDYDFTLPPHDGTLLYETFGWGLSGAQWREMASVAQHDLHATAAPGTSPELARS